MSTRKNRPITTFRRKVLKTYKFEFEGGETITLTHFSKAAAWGEALNAYRQHHNLPPQVTVFCTRSTEVHHVIGSTLPIAGGE